MISKVFLIISRHNVTRNGSDVRELNDGSVGVRNRNGNNEVAGNGGNFTRESGIDGAYLVKIRWEAFRGGIASRGHNRAPLYVERCIRPGATSLLSSFATFPSRDRSTG